MIQLFQVSSRLALLTWLSLQVEEIDEVQDIDIARFILKEVDNAGITVASADRFTARAPPKNYADGEMLLNIFLCLLFCMLIFEVSVSTILFEQAGSEV